MYFLNTTTVCNRAPPHSRGTLIFDNVMVRRVCALAQSAMFHTSACLPTGFLVQGHGCAWTRAAAAITHFTVHLRNGSSSRLPGQVRRQEVSWEKRRKQKQRSLAAGSDLQPWPPTSPSISLTIRTLTKHRCANSMALPAICTYWRNRVFNSALRQLSL